jgi:putative inorganic carbon (hco3(-)) transporter
LTAASHITNGLKKLGTPLKFLILLAIAVGCAVLLVNGFTKVPLFIIGGLVGVLVVYYCLTKPLIGFYIVTVLGYFIAYPERLLRISVPLSTGIEVLVLLLFIGSYASKTKKGPGTFYKTPVSVAFLIYTLFVLVEFFNPNMYSIAGWIFYMRRLIMFLLIYIISYRLFDDMDKIKFFLKLWLFLAFLAAAYACYQQWFGLLPFEMDYLMSDPLQYKLYFQGGSIRKFSFLSDPPTFGVLAGSCAVFMFILAINEKRASRKRLLFFMFFIMYIGMAYSGTRTTNVMLPAALCLYCMLTITNRTTLITVFVSIMAMAFVMFGPIQNNTINRMRSTFDSKDESAAVRDINRHYIQPYIYAHPIGGGIATSGVLGMKYNEGHPLAGFPPDSGLLLAAIELGWIGYAITILVYFLILYQCVHYYFMMKRKQTKLFAVAITVTLFPIIVAQYSQVTIGQLPNVLFFYAVLAIITRMKEFDQELLVNE